MSGARGSGKSALLSPTAGEGSLRGAMSLRLFEILCAATIVLTLAAMSRGRAVKGLVVEYAALALAGFLGEESMIALYRFYTYAPGWDLRILDVPVLVPLIWPLVVLSARDVVAAFAATRPMSILARASLVGALVVFDASLVEVVAVRAGLWSWVEPGHLGVPLVGIAGWGFFAFWAVLPRMIVEARGAPRDLSAWTALSIVSGPLGAHAFVLASWWCLFRWVGRGDLGSTPTRILVAGIAPLAAASVARRAGLGIPLAVAAPRVVAALLFLALLFANAGGDPALLAHAIAVAAPYTRLTLPRSRTVRRDPGREFC